MADANEQLLCVRLVAQETVQERAVHVLHNKIGVGLLQTVTPKPEDPKTLKP